MIPKFAAALCCIKKYYSGFVTADTSRIVNIETEKKKKQDIV
jgi:hypothetical protein